ncbi:dihydroxyacetone kinase [Mycolicibacterium conceptionense]|uniref:Dihydroxyacetone kinase n=1 Tax=Mycolicibacterium conceptionense TaxID=451644 RepID=A0A1A0PNZ8_9MYCO|nr:MULTISPECIES: DAK2 domain-containing protein [Mycolicibacterium]MCW1823439.1 DAK2 domain-containing protein [Mycolicibacterium senegalense]OBB11447.1 dihydroxyacetone kinase [Mycolicibacterium conceptionense]OBF06980.1 dihydroxyacetone kinase [Mycolicibacterium conceptionense]OBF26603.1 dihydroxyacetone kinase [Mycolicibacterium conceptionense]OBF31152.1 dihydroxyacetone kinase [Mycolicibacterium conceptionense]
MSARRLDGPALRAWAHTAVDDLISHTDEINRLNVFPVADADTGTNMLFTMRSAWAHIDAEPVAGDIPALASALAAGALQGARGNSGVILSQILLGLAEAITNAAARRDGDLPMVDAALLGAALRHAAVLAGTSMGEPVPGTIVSVLEAAAQAAERCAAEGGDVADAAAAAGDAAATALDRTPEQLDVLAKAGVVDSGGRGLLVLLDAMTATLVGHAPRRPVYTPSSPQAPLAPADLAVADAPPQFEVMYLLTGCGAPAVEGLRAALEQMGESVAIAASGNDQYSVHVHLDDAGAAVEAGLAVGTLSRIQITALTVGPGLTPAGGWARERAVLAVVDGDGGVELFSGEGAHVLRPKADEPISAQQLLRALIDVGAAQIMVLPNGYVAAEELVAGCTAAIGRGIDVVPVPAGSMVQGLAALAVHDESRQAVDDGYTMARAAAGARHGTVRIASEEALTWAGACKPGDGLGIAGDEVLIVGSDITTAAAGLIDLLMVAGGELITVLTGDGVDGAVGEALQAHVHREHLGAELVTYHTGHRGDALLIGVE